MPLKQYITQKNLFWHATYTYIERIDLVFETVKTVEIFLGALLVLLRH